MKNFTNYDQLTSEIYRLETYLECLAESENDYELVTLNGVTLSIILGEFIPNTLNPISMEFDSFIASAKKSISNQLIKLRTIQQSANDLIQSSFN